MSWEAEDSTMKNITLVSIALGLLASAPAALADDPGSKFCFGVDCPCGNDDPTGGCVNSSGHGAQLDASGTSSVTADDAVFTATHMPAHAVSIILASRNQSAIPFRDGLWCLGSGARRLEQHLNSGNQGSVRFTGVVQRLCDVSVTVSPGETVNFQVWFRDSPAKSTPCGQKHNLTNGYSIDYTP
jgi:hypothetical protein